MAQPPTAQPMITSQIRATSIAHTTEADDSRNQIILFGIPQGDRDVTGPWEALAPMTNAPTDAARAGAASLGEPLDRQADAELARLCLRRWERSGLYRDASKGCQTGECGNDDANVGLHRVPRKPICTMTIDTT